MILEWGMAGTHATDFSQDHEALASMCASRQTTRTVAHKVGQSGHTDAQRLQYGALALHAPPVTRGNEMKAMQRFALGAVTAAMLVGLGACAGMSSQDKSTAIGAGAGAIGGAILTGGSTMGTVGGAAVGGIIGHEVNKSK